MASQKVETAPSKHDVSQLLFAWRAGDETALDRLTPIVYKELYRLAGWYLRRERPGHTLQPTALVNEAFIRLVRCSHVEWESRAHFFAVAAQLMRRILVDFARSRMYQKRGCGGVQVSIDAAENVAPERSRDLVAVDEALTALAVLDPRQSKVVELKFFGGLTIEETAEVLGVSVGTVRRDWSLAKAWIFRELSRGGSASTVEQQR